MKPIYSCHFNIFVSFLQVESVFEKPAEEKPEEEQSTFASKIPSCLVCKAEAGVRNELGRTAMKVQGPVSQKSREHFSLENPVAMLPSTCFEKLIF